MSLTAFLHPVSVNDEKEVIVSKRFIKRDDKGNPILDEKGNTQPEAFRVRAITQAENDALVKRCTRTVKDRNGKTREIDREAFQREIIVAGTVYPDFSDAELCSAYHTTIPQEVPGKMLYAGEYQKLAEAIMDLSGIGDDDEVEEEAKN